MDARSLFLFLILLVGGFYLTSLIKDGSGRTLARAVVIIFAVLWALQGFGLLGGLSNLRIH